MRRRVLAAQDPTVALGTQCRLSPAADNPPRKLWPAMCHKPTYAVQQVRDAELFKDHAGAGLL
jgi:hypothetical protein